MDTLVLAGCMEIIFWVVLLGKFILTGFSPLPLPHPHPVPQKKIILAWLIDLKPN